MSLFKLNANYEPSGDQPKAIEEIVNGLKSNLKHQVLEGVTGSGKTFAMANIIAKMDRPVLILSHTKTLASQLYSEFKTFFPENAVEYFVSYFDYYLPESYSPATDTYVEKSSKTNQDIELMRMSTMNSLLTRKDVIVVASVSAIYGALNPAEYQKSTFEIFLGQEFGHKQFINQLVKIKYDRNDTANTPGTFTVKGDTVIITPADAEGYLIRVDFMFDEIAAIQHIDPLNKTVIKSFKTYHIYPGEAYAVENSIFDTIIPKIENELEKRVAEFKKEGKFEAAERIHQRVKQDIDDMKNFGFCKGIENYSMYLDQRDFGETPYTIFDYFPKDGLIFIDESHMMVSQLGGMHGGDQSRKQNLVDFGFRLPSAKENRPLRFDEFENQVGMQRLYISATPGSYELDKTYGVVTKMYVRPTGLVDPIIEVRPELGQMDDLEEELKKQIAKNERTFILTRTKSNSEFLSNTLIEKGYKCAYIHSDHTTFERNEILRKLRKGVYDVVVGINLLREGIDVPEVSLVAVIEANMAGLSRDRSSLIQIAGRAARNANGRVIFYADTISNPMKEAIEDNKQKRQIQLEYNKKHNITPKTIIKPIPEPIQGHDIMNAVELVMNKTGKKGSESQIKDTIEELRKQMNEAAKAQDFERAIELRDIIIEMEKK
ncbi:excinuclease ABC subunit UvrB [Mycoplasma sp. Ms02]|uniref:excinuclease ABC subunit UvrB n=1 Tax=Mycoplasma sp. Ms02 TaxID=353851 RepID=UPI001C8A8680|nr:excinuclease ABC subunit UvrB [Mycoplasma sp. Ms02]QZE12087.1 excinuclease ABC subunit UvrB [Mycoplasma sp. Ms02]